MNIQKIASIFFVILCIITILILAKSIIIPLIIAVFIWFVIKESREFLDKSLWIKNNIPKWIKTIAVAVFIIFVLGIFIKLLVSNISSLSSYLSQYEENLFVLIDSLEQNFNMDIKSIIVDYTGNFDFQSIAQGFLSSISELFSNTFLIILYLIFILMEESTFIGKLKGIYKHQKEYEETIQLIEKIDKSIGKYITVKTFLSSLTALLSYFTLLLIGIEFALFWAFIIFILNYIPSIGSLIATLFPALMALLQFGTENYTPFIMVLIFVGLIQVLVGNFLEPKMMGNSLNISSLVVILSLSVWWAIWGIVGMVISVPITVMMILVFSQFEKTKNVAILLSEKGLINKEK